MLNKKPILLLIMGICFISMSLVAESPQKFFIQAKWKTKKILAKPTPENALRIPEISEITGSPEDIAKKIQEKGLKLNFVAYPSGQKTKMQSTAILCFDKNHLYALLSGEQSAEYKLKANKQVKESGHIWQDDNFEMFVDPFLSRNEYIHFIVNPIAEVYDNQCLIKMIPDPKATDQSELLPKLEGDIAYSAKATIKTIKKKGEWSVLFKVPFASFGLDSAPLGQPWGFNFCHTNREIKELSQWKVTSGGLGFHTPSKFGVLIFGNSQPPISTTFSMDLAGYGENIIAVKTASSKPEKAHFSVSTSASSAKTEKNLDIPKGTGVQDVPFNVPWDAKGKCKITANLKLNKELCGFFIQNVILNSPLKLTIPLKEIYTSDSEITGLVKLFLGEESLKQAKIRFSVGGKSTELYKLDGNLLYFGINSQGLSPGKHTIAVELLVKDKSVAKQSITINVTEAPFEF
jgi:hypothetical protein